MIVRARNRLIAGRVIVTGATGIAAAYGVSDFIIGATVGGRSRSALAGSSRLALATTIISQMRIKMRGSDIFTGFFLVGCGGRFAEAGFLPK